MSEQLPVHLRAERSLIRRALLVALVTAVITAGLWLCVVLAAPADARPLTATAGAITGVLLCVAAFVAVQRTGELRRVRAQAAAGEFELAQLVDHTVPVAVNMLRDGASVSTVFNQMPRPANGIHHRILRTLVAEIGVGERRRAAATAACANAAGRVQALATGMLADLREMENRSSEETLGDLLKLDHSTAQTGRIADSIAVLTGARSGRRWTKPIRMESVLRGAMGRIGAYQRVRVHSSSAAAVAGYAAEDVMHALAELMDNATRFSPPSEEVHVYVEDLHNGAVVTIEDGGLGMKPQALVRAETAVSQNHSLDLTSLSGTRLGLAVVGCLARKHQLHVFFRPSSRGGTGVVVRIPNQLITQPREDAPPIPAPPRYQAVPAMLQGHRAGAADTKAGTATSGTGTGSHELPKRPRGQTLMAASRPPSPPVPRTTKPRIDAGTRFGAFQQGRAKRAEGERLPSADDDD
jgi:signal transduction histidine kinase